MNVTDVWPVKFPKVSKLKGVGIPCTNPTLVIGLELETENISTRIEYDQLVRPLHFDCHADGSLRGYSTEFITKPMESTTALLALTKFFEATKFTEDNYSDRCSVHVHVNCTDMSMEQLSSVALLYTVVEEILFEFVGGSRDTNIYCIPWNQCRNHLDLVNDFLLNPHVALKRWSKYTALNLLPLATQGTIEFRQMHGTADMKKLTTWINLIGSIFKYARFIPLEALVQEIRGLNTVSTYEMFFTKVLEGSLPYNEVYQSKLEEGIIFAKFSLIKHSNTSKRVKEVEAVKPPNTDAINKLLAELNQVNTIRVPDTIDDFFARPIPAPAPRPVLEAIDERLGFEDEYDEEDDTEEII